MSIADFEILKKLGEGAYSTVFKVLRKSDRSVYALKQVRFSALKEKEKANALTEVRILASVNHPNVTRYKQAIIDRDSNTLCIVMEYIDGGDLLQKIRENKQKRVFFKETELWDILVQSVRGLRALHDLNILHRDIKSANIFLGLDGTAKIGDMNVSIVAKKGLVYTQTGTPYYASPEVWKDQPYNSKSDIWSLGCVIYEAATGDPPFKAPDMRSLFRKVTKGMYPPLPANYSADLANVLKLMLSVEPDNRPSSQRLLDMSLLAKHCTNEVTDPVKSNLLSTIYVPRQLHSLSNKLPAPTYERDRNSTSFPGLVDTTRTGRHLVDSVVPKKHSEVLIPKFVLKTNVRKLTLDRKRHQESSGNIANSYRYGRIAQEIVAGGPHGNRRGAAVPQEMRSENETRPLKQRIYSRPLLKAPWQEMFK